MKKVLAFFTIIFVITIATWQSSQAENSDTIVSTKVYQNSEVEQFKNGNIINISSFISAFIGGIIVLIPFIWQKVKPTRVNGKIIGLKLSPKESIKLANGMDNSYRNVEGSAYNLSISLTVLGRPIMIKNIKLFIKLATNKFEIEGQPYYFQSLPKPPEQFLQFANYMKNDKLYVYDLNIITENNYKENISEMNFDYIRIEFYNFKDKRSSQLYLKREDIDYNSIIGNF